MGRQYSFEDDHYSIKVTETEGHVDLYLQLKKAQPAPARPERPMGRGQRVTVAAHEHQRRQGIMEDEMLILDQGDGVYEVTSRTEPGAFHVVLVDDQGQETCECTAAQYGRLCRHVKGVRVLRGMPVDAPLRANGTSADSFDFSLLTVEPTD